MAKQSRNKAPAQPDAKTKATAPSRRYTVVVHGPGRSISVGRTRQSVVNYFREHCLNLEDYAFGDEPFEADEDAEDYWIYDEDDRRAPLVPKRYQPFNQGCPYECSNVFSAGGAQLGGAELVVMDEAGNSVMEETLRISLASRGCTFTKGQTFTVNDHVKHKKPLFVLVTEDQGLQFRGVLELEGEFNPEHLHIVYDDIDDDLVVEPTESILYNGKPIPKDTRSDDYDDCQLDVAYQTCYFCIREKNDEINTYSESGIRPGTPPWKRPPVYVPFDWEKLTFPYNKQVRPARPGYYECSWGKSKDAHALLFWNGETWNYFIDGEKESLPRIKTWSGLYWNTSTMRNEPKSAPRRRKNTMPAPAKAYPYPHKCNANWDKHLAATS